MKKLIILIITTILCTGCWNYRELNELGIVSAVAISKEDTDYVLDFLLVNTINTEKSGLNESPTTVISAKGKNIYEASRSLGLQTSKNFFLADIKYIYISPEVLKEDLTEIIDFLIRDTKLSLNFLVITSTETNGKDILSTLSHFDINPANNIANIIRISEEKYGKIHALTVKDLASMHLSEGIDVIYPNAYLHGNEKDGQNNDSLANADSENYIEIKNMVFFDHDGNEVTLSDNNTIVYNLINNNSKNISVTIPCEGGTFSFETFNNKFKLIDDLKNNQIKIKGELDAEIIYYGCKNNLNDYNELNKLTDLSVNYIIQNIKETYKFSQAHQYDFLGIGNFIYKKNNKYFDFQNKDWKTEGLPYLNIDTDIKINLSKQGNLKGDLDE